MWITTDEGICRAIDIIYYIPGIAYHQFSKKQSALYLLTPFLWVVYCASVVLGSIVSGSTAPYMLPSTVSMAIEDKS